MSTESIMKLVRDYRNCNDSEDAFALWEAIHAGVRKLEYGESIMQYGVMRLGGMSAEEAARRFPPLSGEI